MPLQHLQSPADAAQWLHAQAATALCSDSRRLLPGQAFVAWPGHSVDGRRHVKAALAAGARACLVEEEGVEAFGFDDDKVACLRGLKAGAGHMASAFFGHPARHLDVVAITGTNGKTSSSWWLAQSLSRLGHRCGVAGTLGMGLPPQLQATGLTTPDPFTLHAGLRALVDGGAKAVAIEASSIGLAEQRLGGLPVRVAVYTNLTQDHLDYHGSMEAYWQAKRSLFDWEGLRAAVINLDDEHGAMLAEQLPRQRPELDVWTYGRAQGSRLRLQALRLEPKGLGFDLVESGVAHPLQSRVMGDYNALNLAAVAASLRALGHGLEPVVRSVEAATSVPGRLQVMGGEGEPLVVVDYAHTPDALSKVMQALKPVVRSRGGRLWCVFGCGGNRDAGKRPLMGAIARREADHVVLTSDNPRDEAPALILSQVLAGMSGDAGVDVIEDRRAAIGQAIMRAAIADVVLLAGKGHEDYQEVAGLRHPFSDVLEAQRALQERGAGLA